MTKHMFSRQNLEHIQEAIVDVFNIFSEVLSTPCTNYEDLKERLEVVDAVKWETIRAKYLNEEYTGYSDGEFTSKEKNTVVKMLYDFIKLVERSSQAVIFKLEDKSKEVMNMEEKMKQMEERVKKTDLVMHAQEDYYKQKCSDNAGLNTRITELQAALEERNRKINELENDKNVHVWESEKRRLMKESEEKIQRLEAENEELQTAKDSLKRRLTSVEDSIKLLKMKQQLSDPNLSSTENSTKGSDKLSRDNFMQDKDIVYLEKQLYDLQTSTVGVIGGMKTDFGMLSHKFYDETTGEVDEGFGRLKSRMEKCYTAIADADVQKAKEEMPAHYRYIENDKFKVKRIKRLSTTAVVPNQRVLSSISTQNKTATVLPTLSGIAENVAVNPVIINPVTKRLHSINPLKYFGHMSQTFILDQYERFQEFDKNGDGSLDLSEMVKVVNQLGFTFTAHQLQEAMEEVDKDNNHTLDFYEFLLIIDNIYKKSGRAELFKDGLKELRQKNVSKSCAVQ